MAAKSIVTSHPEVACEICERRLLRGERPETFLDAETICVVCELCVPRARAAGWSRMQEVDDGWDAARAGARPSSIIPGVLSRLRAWRLGRARPQSDLGDTLDAQPQHHEWSQPAGYDPAEGQLVAMDAAQQPHVPPAGQDFGFQDRALAHSHSASASLHGSALATEQRDADLLDALDNFNRGAHAKRIQSVAGTLGTPTVTLRRSQEHGHAAGSGGNGANGGATERRAESFVLTAAWELCWYRWRVDCVDAGTDAELIDQGYELSDLDSGDLLGNCQVDRRGMVQLVST